MGGVILYIKVPYMDHISWQQERKRKKSTTKPTEGRQFWSGWSLRRLQTRKNLALTNPDPLIVIQFTALNNE